jgi:hypothetical protein
MFGYQGQSAPGGYGTGGQSGSLGLMGSNVGTGQAGITLGAQRGIDNVNTDRQNYGQEMQQNPIGFNNTNMGLFSF